MQTSYSQNFPQVAYPGQLADSGETDVLTGLSLRSPAKTVTITVANSTAYTLSFAEAAGAQTATYTSDGSATKAEIVAGLIAAITANTAIKSWMGVNHGGDLVLVVRAGGPTVPAVVTSTGAGTMTLAALSPEIPFGAAVALDLASANASTGTQAIRLPNSATDKILGLAISSHAMESLGRFGLDPSQAPQYPAGMPVNVCREGRVWAKPETAVVKGDPVYVRYASGGSGLGALANTAAVSDAVAQVTTYTPTAGTAATYQVSINEKTFQYLGDGSDTAAEIVTALIALINADSDLPVTASGTSTLILTADVAGVPFTTSATANMSAAATTANVSKMVLLPGAFWLDTASAGGFARVQLNLH